QPYSSARDEFEGQADVFLDANENPFDTNFNRYPDPLQRTLKATIAKLKGLEISNIFLGNGSDEAIDLLIRLFCEIGSDSILTLVPTYGVYSVFAKTAGVQAKTLPLDKYFQPDLEGLKSFSARNAKILFICNPNNPSASIIPLPVLENIISDFPGIVVVDEAYIDFADTQSCISLVDKYPNLVVLQTFSKAWGLAGVRLGMAFADPELISWLNKIKLPYNINILTQQTVLDKIENKEIVNQEIQTLIAERIKLAEALTDFDFIKKVFPSQANFILVRVEEPKMLYNFLLEKGIIVRDRSNQLNCEACLRITVGTPGENERLIKAMQLFNKLNTSSLLSSNIS
ncbi:MAG: histidinol-phosphate aminotransferase, partial [Saprospiraceae bacterium]